MSKEVTGQPMVSLESWRAVSDERDALLKRAVAAEVREKALVRSQGIDFGITFLLGVLTGVLIWWIHG